MNKKSGTRKKYRATKRRTKKQSRPTFYTVLIVLVGVAVIWGGLTLLQRKDAALAGTRVTQLPASHLPGCTPRYNSTPPTSGCHQPSVAAWGVSQSPVSNEVQVHNLEHGGVLIQYRQNPVPGLDDAYIADLENFVEDIRQQRRYCKVLLAPYPNLDQEIALTAWGWIETLEQFDRDSIIGFINDHIDRAPERNVPCR